MWSIRLNMHPPGEPPRGRAGGACRTLTLQALDVDDVRMALRLIADDRLPLVAEPLIEAGRLEGVRCQDDLLAPPAQRFRLCRLRQRTAQTAAAMRLVHPQVGNHAAAAPRVAVER